MAYLLQALPRRLGDGQPRVGVAHLVGDALEREVRLPALLRRLQRDEHRHLHVAHELDVPPRLVDVVHERVALEKVVARRAVAGVAADVVHLRSERARGRARQRARERARECVPRSVAAYLPRRADHRRVVGGVHHERLERAEAEAVRRVVAAGVERGPAGRGAVEVEEGGAHDVRVGELAEELDARLAAEHLHLVAVDAPVREHLGRDQRRGLLSDAPTRRVVVGRASQSVVRGSGSPCDRARRTAPAPPPSGRARKRAGGAGADARSGPAPASRRRSRTAR